MLTHRAALLVLAATVPHAVAQSVPTPGSPSIPFTPATQAIRGGQGPHVTYQYGIEFVTVSNFGGPVNPNTTSPIYGTSYGSVGYDFRIGRLEITSAQWCQFLNAAFDRPQSQWVPFLPPATSFWGGQIDPSYTGPGRRWVVPAGNELRPVGDISWRMAAIYCNWLHNNQSTDRSAFMNGAYDVGTFGYGGPTGDDFTDQVAHHPGARFWIPTLSEWTMAAHWDPNRYGPGQGGYWQYSVTSDTMPAGGPPQPIDQGFNIIPAGDVNAGWASSGLHEFRVPLGAYPTVQSPWGLLDTAGATSEWLENAIELGGPGGDRLRLQDGSAWGTTTAYIFSDLVSQIGAEFPSFDTLQYGFRIAAAIPSPGAGLGMMLALCFSDTRRRARRDLD